MSEIGEMRLRSRESVTFDLVSKNGIGGHETADEAPKVGRDGGGHNEARLNDVLCVRLRCLVERQAARGHGEEGDAERPAVNFGTDEGTPQRKLRRPVSVGAVMHRAELVRTVWVREAPIGQQDAAAVHEDVVQLQIG